MLSVSGRPCVPLGPVGMTFSELLPSFSCILLSPALAKSSLHSQLRSPSFPTYNGFSLAAFLITMYLGTISVGTQRRRVMVECVPFHCPPLNQACTWQRVLGTGTAIFWCGKGLPGREILWGRSLQRAPNPHISRAAGTPFSGRLHRSANYSSPAILNGVCCVCFRLESPCVPSFAKRLFLGL